jgi:hypothetical protein
MAEDSFVCGHCGKEHPGLPTDWGFRLPDEVHALSYVERYRRARHNADLCTLDESRCFLRGVLLIPLIEAEDTFAWGMWAEIDRATHDRYVSGFETDLSGAPRAVGRLANDIPCYPPTRTVAVEVEFRGSGDRPLLRFPESVSHALAHEQRRGITSKRQHDILDELGFFRDQDEA